jgi:2-polyprenyl-6-methoxyphenol hydroxylase-like FAD-dependent oxidoreductase
MGSESGGARLGTQAAVIGAGMGGMMAAQVLSRFFDRVVLVDKDSLPAVHEPRRGVPQGNHVHTLLSQGRLNLERIFPGLVEEVLANGATWAEALTEFRVCDAAGWYPQTEVGLHTVTCSRPLLEGTVRSFLARNAKVEIRDQTRVEKMRLESGAVTGIEITDAKGRHFLPTDLLIDASGRAGRSVAWLEEAGYGPVEETTIEIGVAYASAIFRRPPDWKFGDQTIFMSGNPTTGERGGAIFAIENDCWLASLMGRFDHQPPTDPNEFMEFARTLDEPDVFDWLSQAERITPIQIYRPRFSKWRRYDKLDSYPGALLPLGDAIAQVNPVRGQGMTLASVHAIKLLEVLEERSSLGKDLAALARPYFERVQEFTQTVWEGLEILEYQCDGVKGDRPADIEMRIAFFSALRLVANDDLEVMRLLQRVGHLVDPPTVLQRPDITERILARMQVAA